MALQIIPPGVEFGHIIHDFDMDGEEDNPSPASEDPPIWSQVTVFSSAYNTQDLTKLLVKHFYLVVNVDILFLPVNPVFLISNTDYTYMYN